MFLESAEGGGPLALGEGGIAELVGEPHRGVVAAAIRHGERNVEWSLDGCGTRRPKIASGSYRGLTSAGSIARSC